MAMLMSTMNFSPLQRYAAPAAPPANFPQVSRSAVDSFVPSQAEETTIRQMTARQFTLESAQTSEIPEWADFGLDQPEQNPKSGDDCWSGNAYGWARAALKQAGRPIPALDSKNSLEAYRKLEKQGKLHFGSPPPGALVFAPKKNGFYRLGFANADGSTFRSTVPSSRHERGIGERRLPDNVAWIMPPDKSASKNKPLRSPKDIHMTQTWDPKFNKTAPGNSADCVPTSTAMGLKALGIKIKGNPEQQISKVRYAMAHGMRNDRDGYVNGKWSLEEHSSGHGLVEAECINGLRKLGVKHAHVAKGVDKLTRAIENGHPVVLFGANGANIWGDKPGYRSRCNSAHAVLLSDYNPKTGLYTINDPLNHRGPIKITRQELARFHESGESVQGVVMKP